MSEAHWQAGKYVFPSEDGSGFKSRCYASIEDAADYVARLVRERVDHAYEEWELGIDGAKPLRQAAQYAERAEEEWDDLQDSSESPEQWLLEDREAKVGNYFVAACGGRPVGPCQVEL